MLIQFIKSGKLSEKELMLITQDIKQEIRDTQQEIHSGSQDIKIDVQKVTFKKEKVEKDRKHQIKLVKVRPSFHFP